jgi:hypothetical protein
LLGALLAQHARRQPNKGSEAWVPSEGLVGVVLDLLQVMVGALHVTTSAAQVPLRVFAHLAAPPHPQTLPRPVHLTVAV